MQNTYERTEYELSFAIESAFSAALNGVLPEKSRYFWFPSYASVITGAIVLNVVSTLILFSLVAYAVMR